MPANEKPQNPLEAVRVGPRFHPAPCWPQVEPQWSPTHYVRVPDSPIFTELLRERTNVRQNWNLGPGWIVAWRVLGYRGVFAPTLGQLWTPDETVAEFIDLQLAINSHDDRLTNSETRRWTPVSYLHALGQGWLPWYVRIETGDVWSWSYRSRLLYDGSRDWRHRPEIALAYVSDDDLRQQVNGNNPDPRGSVPLARPFSTRWITPPEPYPSLLPGEESGARRIDWQQGSGRLVGWSGSAGITIEGEVSAQLGGSVPRSNFEVQAAFHDSEHLISNGSGPDWLSMEILWGSHGGRRFQPLTRRVTAQDQLTVRVRNVAPESEAPIAGDVIFGWQREGDEQPRKRD